MSESGSQAPDLKPARGLSCPRCSSQVGWLPANGVSPVPTYKCLGCATTLTTGSGRLLHAVVGVGALPIAAFGVYQMVTGPRNIRSIGVLVVLGVAIAYCARAVIQPAVRRAEPEGE
ncbi:MAG: hypothetical protein RL591_2288 [Planctomycetota bacterium]|jgi:DNA-directed RNA polymerase subunit RPC12/RpoP